MTTRLVYMSAFALLGMGCASDVSDGPPPVSSGEYGGGSSSPDYGTPAQVPANNINCDHPPSYDEVAAFNTCVMCHSATRTGDQRTGAPATINFDTQAAAEAAGLRAMNVVKGGLMPPRGAGLALSDQDKQELYDWVMCKM